MKIVKNSDSSPEQYYVYDSSDNFLGEIRFQFGQLDVFNYDGESILTKSVNDDFLCKIPDFLRESWIEESVNRLKEYYETK